MRFKKRPIEVEAMQWNGNSNRAQIEEFVGKTLKCELVIDTAYEVRKGPPIFDILIETKEGIMRASRGDWIIKEPFDKERKFYPCKQDVFEKTYEKIFKYYYRKVKSSQCENSKNQNTEQEIVSKVEQLSFF